MVKKMMRGVQVLTALSVLWVVVLVLLTTTSSTAATASAGSITSSSSSRPSLHALTSLLSPSSSYLSDRIPHIERSFVAIKPDGVERHLIGDIIQRLEKKGLKLIAIKILYPSIDLIAEHYQEHRNKDFFQDLVTFFSSGPVVAMIWEGNQAIAHLRKLVGATHPEDALPGTIRGDYAYERGRNLIHSSDSKDNAIREIAIWFKPEEILNDDRTPR